MTDSITTERRSDNMRKIRSKDTKPELQIRKLLFGLGYRFTLHRKDLPGEPDIVFTGRKRVIFIHGCFWHQHQDCREGRVPGSRQEYWIPKLKNNISRDQKHVVELQKLGWKVLVIWECQVTNIDRAEDMMLKFLGPPR
ncbi:MAG: DNA mismatch endonuclease Vsr [Silvibacterium sp.]